MKFPTGFMIGSATAAHQVEGNNIHSDYWALEQMKYSEFPEPSGEACDQYHLYQEDIRLMKEAGLNCYRFSIEWARIEPVKDQFDETEMQHYIDVIDCCIENGIEPIVTLFHFTSPKWLMAEGGWEAESTIERFKRYAMYVVDHIQDKVHYICTINEANMGLQVRMIAERYRKQMEQMAASNPKGEENLQVGINLEAMMKRQAAQKEEFKEVFGVDNPHYFVSPRTEEGDLMVARGHQLIRQAIKEKYPHLKVGLTLSLHDLQAIEGGEAYAAKEWDSEFKHYLPYIKEDDFFGVQNYTRTLVGPEGNLAYPEGTRMTQMNYEFYPEGLEHVIRKVHEVFKNELMVTENGTAMDNDEDRVEFIRIALEGVSNCIQDGIPVIGYNYWSFLDNFEWQRGYSMTFGLVAVDRKTQKRMPKESLSYLGSVAKEIK